MKTAVKIGIIGGIGLTLVAVAAYFEKQANLLKEACSTIAGAIIHQISFTNVSFTLMMNIANKSDIDFTVTNQKYNVYVNNMLVAKIDNPDTVKVNARGTSTVNINVKFNPQDLLKKGIQNITSLIKNKDNMIIEVKGYLSLKAGIISVTDYQVDERMTLKEILSPPKDVKKC